MVFCNHANEVPRGICVCPSDCGCREDMCNDKRAKAQAETIDISPGALFLRIVELERQVKYLQRQINDMDRYVERPIR